MAMTFPPAVERWRPIVAKYFPPEYVDKALWTIQHESGGNPGARGDNGVAIGLFQIQDNRNFANRPDASYLENPENNIRYAAQELGAASGQFGHWGEGTTYQGQAFGAFGHNQWPGQTMSGPSAAGGSSSMGNEDFASQYRQLVTNMNDAFQRYSSSRDEEDYFAWQDALVALSDFRDATGYDPNGDSDRLDTVAQQRFENAMSLEGLDLDRADSAYGRWAGKQAMAESRAQRQIDDVVTKNDELRVNQGARNQSSTPGLLPRNLVSGYAAPTFEDAVKRWQDGLGVGAEPPMPAGGGARSLLPSFDQPPAPPATGAGREPSGNPSIDNQGAGPFSLLPAGQQQRDPNAYQPGNPWNRPTAGALELGPRTARESGGGFDLGDLIPRFGLSGGNPARGTGRAAKKIGKWWQKKIPGLKDGGTNIAAGQYQVGEEGEEILYHPAFGERRVGTNGPEVLDLPEGSSVIPAQEAYLMHQIRSAAQADQGRRPDAEMMERARDPQVTQKALESLRRAMAANYAANPPATPIPYGGAADLYAEWRPLTGVYPEMQEGG